MVDRDFYRNLDFIADVGYRIGKDGSIWSRRTQKGSQEQRRKDITSTFGKWRLLNPSGDTRGYMIVGLLVNGKIKSFSAHSLVLKAFCGPRPAGMQCRHLDGNKSNNRLSNLSWGTPKENAADKFLHGTNVEGEANKGGGKLKELDVRKIRQLREEGKSLGEIAGIFKVTARLVSLISKGLLWKCVK
jgi:hypothetical protein